MKEQDFREKMEAAKDKLMATGSKDLAIELYLSMVKGKTGKDRLDAINKFRCG